MKKYVHIFLNLIISLILGILLALNAKGYFDVSQRLKIIDYLTVLGVVIFIDIIYVLVKVSPLNWKIINILLGVFTLIAIFYFNGEFNPF